MAKTTATRRSSWKDLKRHSLSAAYHDITGRAWSLLTSNVRQHGIVGGRCVTLLDGMVVDGWQLYRACIEADIKPKFRKLNLPQGMTAEEWVETANDLRRHETQEVAMKRADERRERVASARAEGKSTRAIAAEEGVSEKIVRNDVAASGAAPSAPGDVEGLDGKRYPRKRAKTHTPKPEQRPEPEVAHPPPQETPPPATDAEGHLITAQTTEAFTTAKKFKEIDTLIQDLQAALAEIAVIPGGEQLRMQLKATTAGDKTIHKSESLEEIKRLVKFCRPHSICPGCKGKALKLCRGCSGRGWVSSVTWKDFDADTKARLEVSPS